MFNFNKPAGAPVVQQQGLVNLVGPANGIVPQAGAVAAVKQKPKLTRATQLKDLKKELQLVECTDLVKAIEAVNYQIKLQEEAMKVILSLKGGISDYDFVQLSQRNEDILMQSKSLQQEHKEIHSVVVEPLQAEKGRLEICVDATWGRANVINNSSNMYGGYADVAFPSPVLSGALHASRAKAEDLLSLLSQTESAVSEMGNLAGSGTVDPRVEEEMLKQVIVLLTRSVVRIASECVEPMTTEVGKLRTLVTELMAYTGTTPKSGGFLVDPFEKSDAKERVKADEAAKKRADLLKQQLDPPVPVIRSGYTTVMSGVGPPKAGAPFLIPGGGGAVGGGVGGGAGINLLAGATTGTTTTTTPAPAVLPTTTGIFNLGGVPAGAAPAVKPTMSFQIGGAAGGGGPAGGVVGGGGGALPLPVNSNIFAPNGGGGAKGAAAAPVFKAGGAGAPLLGGGAAGAFKFAPIKLPQ